jgi:hypothetical protein
MPGSKRPSEGQQTDQLIAAVRELTEQIEVLRNVIDELRSGFVWAVRNERLGGSDRPEDSSPSSQVTVAPRLELDEDQLEAIAEVVQDNLREVSDDLAEVVRGQLREELSELRDSLDQFSIDMTWAARQVRNAGSSAGAPVLSAANDPTPADRVLILSPSTHRLMSPSQASPGLPSRESSGNLESPANPNLLLSFSPMSQRPAVSHPYTHVFVHQGRLIGFARNPRCDGEIVTVFGRLVGSNLRDQVFIMHQSWLRPVLPNTTPPSVGPTDMAGSRTERPLQSR